MTYDNLDDEQFTRDRDCDIDQDDDLSQSVAQVADIDRPDSDADRPDRWG